MKNLILALICVLVCSVTVEAACTSCGNGRVRTIRRAPAPARKVLKQRAHPLRLRGTCSNGRCSN